MTETTRPTRLAHLRAARDLTMGELAAKAGVSVETVRKLERGLTPHPQLRTLHRVARALEVPIDTLLDAYEGAA